MFCEYDEFPHLSPLNIIVTNVVRTHAISCIRKLQVINTQFNSRHTLASHTQKPFSSSLNITKALEYDDD